MGSRTTAHLKPFKEKIPKKGNQAAIRSYDDIFFPKEKPLTEAYASRLGREFIDWCINNTKAYKIRQFCTEKGISSHTLYDLAARYEVMKRALQEGKEILGDRREIGGLTFELQSTLVLKSMPQYDDGWKKQMEWEAALNAKLQAEAMTAAANTVIINKRAIPTSDLVPDLPE